MPLLKLLLIDVFIAYWHVLAACIFLAQLRFWIGNKWIMVAFLALILFAIYAESLASPEDKDGVFIIGSFLRIILASTIFGVGTYGGILIRRKFSMEAKS